MAFDSLTDKLNSIFGKLRSKGKLTESDVRTAMREVKMALLEADVNFKVVKQFVSSVQERAIGEEVMRVRVRRRQRRSLPASSSRRERSRFWSLWISIDPRRSNSCRSTAKRSAWKSSPWETGTNLRI